jgi:hypothetical protein
VEHYALSSNPNILVKKSNEQFVLPYFKVKGGTIALGEYISSFKVGGVEELTDISSYLTSVTPQLSNNQTLAEKLEPVK